MDNRTVLFQFSIEYDKRQIMTGEEVIHNSIPVYDYMYTYI